MKVRINDLARELEVKSKAILDALAQVGIVEKKTHSSSLEVHEAELVRRYFKSHPAPRAMRVIRNLWPNLTPDYPYWPRAARGQRKTKPTSNQKRRGIQVFVCHSSGDKKTVRKLYRKLKADGFLPWLDEENLIPGQEWAEAISKAVRDSHVVVVCLSMKSITKEGFVQKEIRFALDVADEKPQGTIFLIPVRLEEVAVPERLSKWHWVDWFRTDGYERLVKALDIRADSVNGR